VQRNIDAALSAFQPAQQQAASGSMMHTVPVAADHSRAYAAGTLTGEWLIEGVVSNVAFSVFLFIRVELE